MRPDAIADLLARVQRGECSVPAALGALRTLPFEQGADVVIDHHRELRTGLVECVFAASKTSDQVVRALRAIHSRGQPALATRVPASMAPEVLDALPEVSHDPVSRTLRLGDPSPPLAVLPVAIVCAGTSDVPVAEEARVTLATFGAPTTMVTDVGVAGIHRLLARLDRLAGASVVIVVAGMEGALPSVVGGLVGAPVVAVPTSVGYGAAAGGFAALFGMLGSCAAGVSVVNIDNGFGAACAALRILKSAR